MTTERLPWFRCFPESLLGALSALPSDTGYVYCIILLRIYEVRGPIKDTPEAIARRTGFRPSRVAKCIQELCESGKLIRLEDGSMMNPFAERELNSSEKILTQTRTKRIAAAKTSWEKRKQNQQNADAPAMQKDADSHIDSQSPVGSKEEPTDAARHRMNGFGERLPFGDKPHEAEKTPEADYFRRGREILGQKSGSVLAKLLKLKGNVSLARAAIEMASTKNSPMEYVGAMLRGSSGDGWSHGSAIT